MANAHLKVELIGKAETKRALENIDARVQSKLKIIVLDTALNIQRMSKEKCPVRKDPKAKVGGRLRGSISVEFSNNGFAAKVGTNVYYAAFVEFGTGVRGASSSVLYLPDSWKYGSRPGQSAQPYLYPAFAAEKPHFERRVEKEVPDAFK